MRMRRHEAGDGEEEVNTCWMAKGFVRQEEDSGFSAGGNGELWKSLVNTHAWLVNASDPDLQPPLRGHPCLSIPLMLRHNASLNPDSLKHPPAMAERL